MKPQFITPERLALLLLTTLLTAGCNAKASDNNAANAQAPDPLAYQPAPDVAQDVDAPDTIPATTPPPAAPALSANLADVVKLVQAGVGDSLIQSFIRNTAGPFGLNSSQIIYLHDLGTSDGIIDALLAHDRALTGAPATPAPAPVVESQPALVETPVAAAPDQPVVVVGQPAPVTVTYFYQSLSPYGIWVDVAGYGRCWQPFAAMTQAPWQPYCDNGHWVYSNYGWYWASDYSWGGTVFHYGRWVHHPQRGWLWLPDTTWGPAWVSWREADDYCGWAPLPPNTVWVAGSGLFFEGRLVGADFDFGFAPDYYTFVDRDHFRDRHPEHYAVPHQQAAMIISHTTVVNNFTPGRNNTPFNHGIDPARFNHRPGGDNHPAQPHPATPAAPFTAGGGHDFRPASPTHAQVPVPNTTTPSQPVQHPGNNSQGHPHPVSPVVPATIQAVPQHPVLSQTPVVANPAPASSPHPAGFTTSAPKPAPIQQNLHAGQPALPAVISTPSRTEANPSHFVPAPMNPELSSPRRQNSVATQVVPQPQAPAAAGHDESSGTPAPAAKHHKNDQQ